MHVTFDMVPGGSTCTAQVERRNCGGGDDDDGGGGDGDDVRQGLGRDLVSGV